MQMMLVKYKAISLYDRHNTFFFFFKSCILLQADGRAAEKLIVNLLLQLNVYLFNSLCE